MLAIKISYMPCCHRIWIITGLRDGGSGFVTSKKTMKSTGVTRRRFGVGWLGSPVCPRDSGSPRNPVLIRVRFPFFS
jgi:hypothetical protein